MSLLLVVGLMLFLFGGSGAFARRTYGAHRAYGLAGIGGALGLVMTVTLVFFLYGGLQA